MNDLGFVHLHLHTEYSLLDGACRIKELPAYVKSIGQTAAAITDHGVMYGAVEFYKECKKQGIKPIIGCEVYVARRSRFDKVHGQDDKPYHLVLLCKDNKGYENLIKLVSYGYTEGFYNKPRIDRELISKYSGGLIALSGCLAGEVQRNIMNNDEEAAEEAALFYKNTFGRDNYYIELQDHGTPDDKRLVPRLVKLAERLDIPCAATNDAHYIRKGDASVQRVLIAIQTNTLLDEPSPLAFPTDEFYIKTEEEMRPLFAICPEAVDNTAKIADMCNVEFEFGKIKLPKFTMEGVSDNTEYFTSLCFKGLKKRYGTPTDKAVKRLEYELSVIKQMGFVDYYLIVWDFIRYAKEHGIPVGPGRGSGAGSLAAYCIGITGIDPLKYNLLFERFLNPERVSMPDFDIDFCYERRQEVIDYVVRKYGDDRVAQIITFGTMAAKAAVKDVARVMNVPYQLSDKITKLIPFGLHVTLEKAMNESAELRELYESDRRVREVIAAAMKLEGMPRHASTHAAGVVISDRPVRDYVPLYKADGGSPVTQYTMTVLESLGLLKMDFLGLRNLTVISDCEKAIKRIKPDFSINKIPDNDAEAFEMMSKGDTTGVFQFESEGMRQVLIKMKPRSIEDLTAALSLYRPGPMDSIPKYLENREHPEKKTYAHPILKDILDVTCGCIVYQEQVMEICRKMAGYSYGRADLVRRAMAKKKHEEMEKERSIFVSGSMKNGVPEDVANSVFDEMSGFASYAFNKSHAAAYSVVAYETAYLKCHYYAHYMAALMTSVLENTGKLIEYISCCESSGVHVLPPDINESEENFTVSGGSIRFALLALKGVGWGVISSITDARKDGRFVSIQDFCRRMQGRDFNKRALESLIKCGAFDRLGHSRRTLLENYESLYDDYHDNVRKNIDGQMDFFGDPTENSASDAELEEKEEYPHDVLLKMEKEIIGIYISGHPLDSVDIYRHALRLNTIAEITAKCSAMQNSADGMKVSFIAECQGVKLHTAKNGSEMAFANAEDKTGTMECIIFSELFRRCRELIMPAENGVICCFSGKISMKDGEPKLLADSIISADELKTMCNGKKLYIRISDNDMEKANAIVKIMAGYPGNGTAVFCLEPSKRKITPKNANKICITQDMLEQISAVAGIENIFIR